MKGLIDKGLLAQFWEQAKGEMGGGCSEELLLALLPATAELEDLAIRAGSFANAGEGWNTFLFPEPFEGVPFVAAQCDGCGVEVKGAAPDRFLYKVTRATAGATTTRTLYTGASSAYPLVFSYPQSNYKTSFDVLTGAEAGGTAPVADAVEVRWMAVEYGGDES